jgi:DNA-binding NarL/FixJ family response regulator
MNRPSPLRIALIDESELVRHGLMRVCSSDARLVVTDPSVADLVLYDPFARGVDGLHRLRVLTRESRAVAAFSWSDNPESRERARHSGAVGLISKKLGFQHLREALVGLGRRSRAAGTSPADAHAGEPGAAERPALLSVREAEVLQHIATGATNEETAARMFVSLNTLKSYIRSAYRKIGVERRSQAVLWTMQNCPPA